MNKYNQNNRNQAFTIIELLIVIVIIGVLVAIAAVAYNGLTNSAKEMATKTDIENIKKGVNIYSLNNNEDLPKKEQDLIESGLSDIMNKSHFINNVGYNLDREQNPPIIEKGQYYIVSYQEANWWGETSVYYWDYENDNWTAYHIKKENKWMGTYYEKIKYEYYGDDSLYDANSQLSPCKARTLNECGYSRVL